jgi:biopolymer transport protein TolR
MSSALSASQRAKIRRLSAPKELAPDEEGGELNVIPFLDIIMNVLMFVLATISVTFTATIQTSPPRAGGSRAAANQTPSLSLTVLIVDGAAESGFSVKARGGNVAPGCQGTGAGIAIPKQGGKFDYEGLKRCATNLKAASEDFKEERQVTLSANPNIPYEVLVATMDALRTATPKPGENIPEDLFPEVNFGLAK